MSSRKAAFVVAFRRERPGSLRLSGGVLEPTGASDRRQPADPEAHVGGVGRSELVRVDQLLRELGHRVGIPSAPVEGANRRELGQGLALQAIRPLVAPIEDGLDDLRTGGVGEEPPRRRGQLQTEPKLLGAAITVIEPARDRGQQHRQFRALDALGEGAAQVEGRHGEIPGIGLELHGRAQVGESGRRGHDVRFCGGGENQKPAAITLVEGLSQHAAETLHRQLVVTGGEELVCTRFELVDRPGVAGRFAEHEVSRHLLDRKLPPGQHPGRLGVRLGLDGRRHLRVHRRPFEGVAELEGVVAVQQAESHHRVDSGDDLFRVGFGQVGHRREVGRVAQESGHLQDAQPQGGHSGEPPADRPGDDARCQGVDRGRVFGVVGRGMPAQLGQEGEEQERVAPARRLTGLDEDRRRVGDLSLDQTRHASGRERTEVQDTAPRLRHELVGGAGLVPRLCGDAAARSRIRPGIARRAK